MRQVNRGLNRLPTIRKNRWRKASGRRTSGWDALSSFLESWKGYLALTSFFEFHIWQDVKLRIEKVTLFRNGLGYILSEATLPENATTIRVGQLPVPSFGTFWVGYSEQVNPKHVLIVEIELKSGDEQKVSYQYQVYIRR